MRGGLVATGTVTDPAGQAGRRGRRRPGRPSLLGRGQPGGPDRRAGPVPVPAAAGRAAEHHRHRPGLDARDPEGRDPARAWRPFDFRLEPGKELKLRFVDAAGKPVPGVGVMIDKWRGGESLYNHKHPTSSTRRSRTRPTRRASTAGPGPRGRRDLPLLQGGMCRAEVDADRQRARADGHAAADPADHREGHRRGHGPADPAMPTAIPVLEFSPGRLFTERNHAEELLGRNLYDRGRPHRRRVPRADRGRGLPLGHERGRPRRGAGPERSISASTRRRRWKGRVVDPRGPSPSRMRASTWPRPRRILNDLHEDQGNVRAIRRSSPMARAGSPSPPSSSAAPSWPSTTAATPRCRLKPDQQPGDLALKPWAHDRGPAAPGGQARARRLDHVQPIRLLGGGSPHIQDRICR